MVGIGPSGRAQEVGAHHLDELGAQRRDLGWTGGRSTRSGGGRDLPRSLVLDLLHLDFGRVGCGGRGEVAAERHDQVLCTHYF